MITEVVFNMESFLTPILDMGVLLVFIILMIFFYTKLRMFSIILLITLISLIIGVASIQLTYSPFTPYIQLFFICFQVVFFLKTAIQYTNEKKKEK